MCNKVLFYNIYENVCINTLDSKLYGEQYGIAPKIAGANLSSINRIIITKS